MLKSDSCVTLARRMRGILRTSGGTNEATTDAAYLGGTRSGDSSHAGAGLWRDPAVRDFRRARLRGLIDTTVGAVSLRICLYFTFTRKRFVASIIDGHTIGGGGTSGRGKRSTTASVAAPSRTARTTTEAPVFVDERVQVGIATSWAITKKKEAVLEP